MTGLGSGGDAKASGADRADTDPLDSEAQMERFDDENTGTPGSSDSTSDAAMGANADPDIEDVDANVPQLGAGETAAYGDTVGNMTTGVTP